MTIEQSFGAAIREIRSQKGLSQEKLAFETGLDRTFISLLERGMRQPTLKTIQKLAEIFEMKASDLIAATEKLYCDES